MRVDHGTNRSGSWLPWLAAAAWIGGAGVSAAWIFETGGVVKPIAAFAGWTAALFIFMFALAAKSSASPKMAALAQALRFAGFSVTALLLGILFVEYWPVTLSMACMFAICRGVESEAEEDAHAPVFVSRVGLEAR